MKKFLLLIAMLLTINFLYSQGNLIEDFSGNMMPPEGWEIEDHIANWRMSSTNKAGGEAPEAHFYYDPDFIGTTRLISPLYDVSEYDYLTLKFNYYIDYFSDSFNIGIAVRNDGEEWNIVWEKNVTSSNPATQEIIPIENYGGNSTSFQYCFFFEGNSYYFNDIYLDDFVLFNSSDLDLAINTIDFPIFEFQGEHAIKTNLINLGVQDIDSFEINWQVDNGEIHTEQVVQNILPFNTYIYTFEDNWNATSGVHDLRIWLSEVNGGDDDMLANNEKIKTISIASQSVPRLPLIEEFTSSTCGPCASFNGQFEPWSEEHDDIAIIKYQMNWPGSGDIYYTLEGGTRRVFYGINAVPMLACDGTVYSASLGNVNTFYNSALNNDAMMEIDATHQINGETIMGSISINPFITVDNMTLHIVVVEKETTGNVGSNGETEFKQVMMKMIPDAEGTSVSLTDGTPYVYSFEQDLSNTNVEDFEDLEVIAFVQYNPNMSIMQTAISEEGDVPPPPAPTATLNVENEESNIDLDTEFIITFDQPIRAIDNSELTNENIHEHIIFYGVMSIKNDIEFEATINSNKTIVTVTPITDLYGMHCTLGMEATVENNYDTPIVPFEIEFSMIGFSTSDMINDELKVYPNPASDKATISFDLLEQSDVVLELYNTSGEVYHQQKINDAIGKQNLTINTSHLEKGVYICKLDVKGNIKFIKLVVM